MNKSAIKTFALWARKTLTAQIIEGADQIGITPQGVADPLPQSTYQMRYYRDSSGAVTGRWGEAPPAGTDCAHGGGIWI